jgi:hypothetical protein
MRPSRSVLALVAALTFVPSWLAAQVGTQAVAFSCADTTNRSLGFLVGEYRADATFRAGAAAWDSAGATVSITRDLGGCVLREHFRGTRYGAPYEYLALWSANGGAATPLQRAFVHSQHGLLGVSAGRIVGDSLVLEDSAFVRGRWIHQQVVLWRADVAGTVLRSESRRSEDARASWFPTQRILYERRVR